MKNHNRKAFTVVELVIVIAVIAILAAVLIPTFSGIVKKAHVSNDTQLAANMTMQLRTEDNDIRTEVELKKAMDALYGADYFLNLAPQSADQGYHFWFDITTQTVLLAKVDGLDPVPSIGAGDPGVSVYDLENVTMGDPGVPAPLAVDPVAAFAPGAPRTAIVAGYYLMDRKGSKLADEITTAETSADPAALSSLTEAFTYLQNLVFANENGIHGSLEGATALYFSPFVNTIGGNGLTGNHNITSVTIPAGVKVGPAAINGVKDNSAENPNIYVDVEDGEDLLDVFLAGDANKSEFYVTISNGDVYKVENNNIYPVVDGNQGATIGGLDFANNVRSFSVRADSPAVEASGKYYVACDVSTLNLIADNFAGERDGAPSSTTVTWTSSDTSVATVNESTGEVSVKMPVVDGPFTTTIRATATAGGHYEELTLYVVRPINPYFTVGGNECELSGDGTGAVELLYTETSTSVFEAETNPGLNTSGVVNLTTAFKFESSGNVFDIDQTTGKITLKDGKTSGAQDVTVSYGTYFTRTFAVNITDTTSAPFEGALISTDNKAGQNYLFRIGDDNAVTLDKLFAVVRTVSEFNVEVYDITTKDGDSINPKPIGTNAGFDATVTLGSTLAESKIQFTGTGIARIDIGEMKKDAEGNPDGISGTAFSLYVEVVDGKNVVDYDGLKSATNYVLMNKIDLPSGSWSLSNGTLYGNGFTFDVTKGAYNGTGGISSNYLIGLSNANLDNVVIVGPVYTAYNAMAAQDYNRSVVGTTNICGIYNSYISNAAAPVRANSGELTLVNTTLKGGSLANLEMRGCNLIIDGLTTINQVNSNDAASDGKVTIGLGIVVWYEGLSGSEKITIQGAGLTQYNYVSNEQSGNAVDIAQSVYGEMFGIKGDFIKTIGGVKWVNTGILSLMESLEGDNINTPSGYGWDDVSYLTYDGHLCTQIASNFPADPATYAAPAYMSDAQYSIQPTVSVEYPTENGKKNYIAKTDDSPDYCYYDSQTNTILIRFEKDSSFSFDPDILTITKFGKNITPTVSMNSTVYEDDIIFTQDGNYTITYTYTDQYNYKMDDGIVATYSKQHTRKVNVEVALKDKALQAPIFTFNGTVATPVAGNNGNTYLTVSTGVVSTTAGGQTIKHPKIYVKINDNLTATDDGTSLSKSGSSTAFCPIFDGVVTITDNGTTYDGGTTTLADGRLQMISDRDAALKWSSANAVPVDNPVVKSGKLYFQSATISGVERSQETRKFEYVYTAKNGDIYHYFVEYVFPKKASSCITPETLVTLADGTQKEIQYVTYEDQLLVWNFFTGEYDTMPASIVMNHGYDLYKVVTLEFDDGTKVNTINGHGFFDIASREYVILSDDNAADYIGHEFIKVDGNGYTTVKLAEYTVSEQYTESWSVLTAAHYNCILENMWTLTPAEVDGSPDYLMPFEVAADLKYDEDKMLADIEKYGQYTYEDFAEYCTYEQFMGFAFPNWKVAVGKGYITWDGIEYLLKLHLG